MNMRTWWIGILALALLLVFSAPGLSQQAANQQQGTESFQGKVIKLWTDQNRFSLRDAKGAEWTFELGRDAAVRLNDKDSKLADLKEGDEVTVTYRKMVQDINAGKGAQSTEVARGHIQRVTADQNQFILKDKNNKEWTIHLTRDAKIRLNDREGKLADLKEGDEVAIFYEKQGDMLMACDVLSNRGAGQAADLTRGEIKSVSADQHQLVLKDRDGKERTFQVSRDAKVRVDNQDRKLSDLKEGETAAVTYLFMVTDLRSRRQ